MAKITIFLLCLLLKSNAFAENYWWNQCNWVFTTHQGWYCQIQYQPPACINQTEYQTLSCPVHQSGAINQSRNYNCTAGTWSAWTTTSNNCTQDPPTCHTTTETRQLACQSGYNGNITQSRSSVCSDPYGTPTWMDWVETGNTCVMTATNINNPTSPISPISPTNPNSVISKSIAPVESATAQDLTATVATPSTEVKGTTTISDTGVTSASSTTTLSASSSAEKKDVTVATNIPKGKEIVPGFGVVISMQLINTSYNMQQQQIQEYINLTQEYEDVRQQNFLIDLIATSNIGDNFNRIADYRWRSLLGNNSLQRSGFSD
jgi:hypothetical protein